MAKKEEKVEVVKVAPKVDKIIVEGLEDADQVQLKAAAEALDKEATALEDGDLRDKRSRAQLIRKRLKQLADECGCKNFTKINEVHGRIILECDVCKTQYIAMRGI